jgi:hypothetical protein
MTVEMSNTKDGGGPAFPCDAEWKDGSEVWPQSPGMTLRDWFAGQALASVIPTCNMEDIREDDKTKEMLFARKVYRIADAMLKARK